MDGSRLGAAGLSTITPAAEQCGLGPAPSAAGASVSSPATWKQEFLLGDLTMKHRGVSV